MDQPEVPWGPPNAERADAARNRRHLLATAREMLAGQGPDTLTMDALAERAGLGKGTVFLQSQVVCGARNVPSGGGEAGRGFGHYGCGDPSAPAAAAYLG